MAIKFETFGGIGAQVHGLVPGASLSVSDKQTLLDGLHRHLVLIFRQHPLTDHEFAAFAKNFGELEHSPIPEGLKGTGHVPDTPEIAVVSNVIVDGTPIGGLGDGEASWHTDMSYIEQPPPVCMLQSLQLPPEGGDTWYTSMYMAYDSLPDALKARIEGLELNHDSSTTSTGTTRRSFEQVTDVSLAPGARHPIVRVHPGTGRKTLYLGRRLNAWIVGLPVAESEALLDELWAYCAQPEHTYRHVWQLRDLVIWDNRCTMHRREAWTPNASRTLHRAQLRNVITA